MSELQRQQQSCGAAHGPCSLSHPSSAVLDLISSRDPPSRCIPSSSPVFCVSSHFTSRRLSPDHTEGVLRTLPSLLTSWPPEQAVQTCLPFSSFHAHPMHQLRPSFSATLYSADNDFMTFPSPNLIDSSCTHSFQQIFIGVPVCTELCSSCSGSVEEKRPRPPAAESPSQAGWSSLGPDSS